MLLAWDYSHYTQGAGVLGRRHSTGIDCVLLSRLICTADTEKKQLKQRPSRDDIGDLVGMQWQRPLTDLALIELKSVIESRSRKGKGKQNKQTNKQGDNKGGNNSHGKKWQPQQRCRPKHNKCR